MNISDLLHDAVDGVEPADRIDELRARTADPARSAARPWFYAAGGVVLATAAAVTAFAVLGNDSSPDPDPHHDHGVVSQPTPGTQVVPAYFLGDTERGARLFREFDEVPGFDPLQVALERIQRPASDPDYRTSWTPGSFESATQGDGTIDVEVGIGSVEAASELSLQQVVYTLQGALQRPDLPVRFLHDGEVLATVDALPQTEVLNLMSISDPSEGSSYSGSFTARGRASSFEGAVLWELRARDGDLAADGFATASGAGDQLYPWETEVDLSGLPPGRYVFVARTDDPSGGTEGFGPASDTRLITVR